MEVVEGDEGVAYIDIEPPLTEAQHRDIRLVPAFYDLRKADTDSAFRDRTPDSGEPFTEINCDRLRKMVREMGLILDENNFAGQIVEVLERHGSTVELVTGVPLELRSHKFLGLKSEAPADAAEAPQEHQG